MPANLENSVVGTGLEKVSFPSNTKERQCKECSSYCTIALISQVSKVMLKVLQARLQQYMNWELSYVQAGFRKGRRTRDQIANIRWITEKAREFQNSFCYIDYTKAFDCGSQQTGKFWKRWEYQTTLPASCETCMQVKKQQLDSNMEQWTGSKLGKEYSRLYIVTLLI